MMAVGMAATMLASCATDTVFDRYVHTPVSGWEKNDTLTMQIPKVAAAGDYTQQIGVRMTSAYPFMSISLIVEQEILPRGATFTDTVKCEVTDSRGNFLGSGVSTYQYQFPLRELRLAKGDSIYVSIRHNMKREILPGVSDIGLKMERR